MSDDPCRPQAQGNRQATSARGVRARIRRVAGCAPPTGFAGHAGATANLKLTFHLDHSAGADQRTIAAGSAALWNADARFSIVRHLGRFRRTPVPLAGFTITTRSRYAGRNKIHPLDNAFG